MVTQSNIFLTYLLFGQFVAQCGQMFAQFITRNHSPIVSVEGIESFQNFLFTIHLHQFVGKAVYKALEINSARLCCVSLLDHLSDVGVLGVESFDGEFKVLGPPNFLVINWIVRCDSGDLLMAFMPAFRDSKSRVPLPC